MKTLTLEQLRDLVAEQYGDEAPEVSEKMTRWLDRGDKVAVYRNEDFGHRDLGMIRLASYGSEHAYFETDSPPVRLPDTPTEINWRYQLYAVYTGEQAPEGEVRDEPGR
jgi:hypothetical protein